MSAGGDAGGAAAGDHDKEKRLLKEQNIPKVNFRSHSKSSFEKYTRCSLERKFEKREKEKRKVCCRARGAGARQQLRGPRRRR